MDDVRETVLRLAQARGESLAALSRMCGRNAAYLQQFIHRNSPRRLDETARRLLAMHFGIDEAALGGPARPAEDMIDLPWLAVRAAAGAGRVAEETVIRPLPFAARLLRDAGIAPSSAAVIAAAGDSMTPTIGDGDRLVVDGRDRSIAGGGRDGGIFVFRHEDDLLSVKRLARAGAAIRIVSDNPAYPERVVDAGKIEIVGRIRLLLRAVE